MEDICVPVESSRVKGLKNHIHIIGNITNGCDKVNSKIRIILLPFQKHASRRLYIVSSQRT